MKRISFLFGLIATFTAYAEPSSQIAWTPEILNLVKGGDAANGKKLAESCKSCHGENGQGLKAENGMEAIPALAGQLATYTYKQLRDYFNGSRSHDMMSAIAKGLSEQDAADLAAWFASLPAPLHPPTSKQLLPKAEKLVADGDGKRILPPCFVCHGNHGRGEKMDMPVLAGQQADYLTAALSAYKSGQRHNDIYSRMRLIAKQLSTDEIEELAKYYQQLQ